MNKQLGTVGKRIGLLILPIILLTGGYFLLDRYFTIKTIKVFGEREAFETTTNLDDLGNIVLLDTDTLSRELQKDNPLNKKITIEKEFPDTLVIYTERRISAVALRNQSDFLILDDEGFILSQSNVTDSLPLLSVESAQVSSNGQIADARIRNSIQIVLNTARAGFQVEQADVRPDANELVMSSNGSRIIVPLNHDPIYLFSSLQLLMRQFRIEGKRPVQIDFRFEKPVVRFTQT